VGRKVAVVLWPEVKKDSKAHRRPDQVNFSERLTADGGIAGFVDSPEAALKLLADYKR